MDEVVAAIETAEPSANGSITHEALGLDFPRGQDDTALQALLGEISYTPLAIGVDQTMRHFKEARGDGRMPATSSG